MSKQKIRPNDPCPCGSGDKFKKCHKDRPEELAAMLGKKQGSIIPPAQPAPRPLFGTVRPGNITPLREVPSEIVRPDYAGGPAIRVRRHHVNKVPEQVERMRTSCRLAREVLDITIAAANVGVTTEELDRIAHEAILERNAYPSTLGYSGYPKSICTSVNEVICHGIPDDRPLQDGDTVNIDVTIFHDGMHGDLSETVLIGNVAPEHKKLVDVTYECLQAGIDKVGPGVQLNSVGRAIVKVARPHGYGVVEHFVGHGIGELFHMDPHVSHVGEGPSFILRPGMTFTIEPMINEGTPDHVMWDDNWTAVTADLKRSAQAEHTVLVTESGAEILTARRRGDPRGHTP